MRKSKVLNSVGAVFLSVLLLIGLLPTQVFAADSIKDAYLLINGQFVTDNNKDDIYGDGGSVKAAYDADANQVIVTLTNADISRQGVAIQINSDIPLVINLVGDNKITVTGTRECIYYNNNLTIQGQGTLLLESKAGNAIANSSSGDASPLLVISGVPSLTAKGLYKGIGVVGDVNIENSTVTVNAEEDYNPAFEASGEIEIAGSTVNVTAKGSGTRGIYSMGKSVSISDSDVRVNSVAAAIQSNKDIIVSGGTLDLSALGEAQNCVNAAGTLRIENGADVTATSYYPALYGSQGMVIADSRVQAKATNDIGIWTRGDLSVSGNVDIVSNGIAMASGCAFTVTPPAGSLLEVKTGTSEEDARHLYDSPFAEITELPRLDNAYCSIKKHVHMGGIATCKAAAICDDCGQSYGMPDPSHHSALIAVAEKPATCVDQGNSAYWYCSDCGTYFSDANCDEVITLESTILKEKGHQYNNGICTICGAKDPSVQVVDQNKTPQASGQSTVSSPQTGDSMALGGWLCLLLAVTAVLIGVLYYRKKTQ